MKTITLHVADDAADEVLNQLSTLRGVTVSLGEYGSHNHPRHSHDELLEMAKRLSDEYPDPDLVALDADPFLET